MIIISKIKIPTGRYIEDLTGQKFGRLTVLKLTDKKSDNRWLWKCKCDCENIIRLVRIPYTDFNKIDTNYILDRIGDKIE